MSTSNKTARKTNLRTFAVYLAVAAFCGVFSYVYELHSHEVYSNFMIFLFAYPLVLGALPFGVAALAKTEIVSITARILWHCAVATVTVWSAMCGVFEIYGSENAYLKVYVYVFPVLFAASAITLVAKLISNKKHAQK